jgi:hypothetical protein
MLSDLLSTQCYQVCYRHNVIRFVIDTMLSDLLSTQCIAKIAQRTKKVNLAKKSIVILYYKVAHLPQRLDVFLDFQRVQKI